MENSAQILDMHGKQFSIPSRSEFGVILEAPEGYEMRFFAGWFWCLSPHFQPLKLSENGRTWKKVDANTKDGAECLHIIQGLIAS